MWYLCKEVITKLTKSFEEHAYEENGVEFWLARELQVLLGYTEWRNFLGIIEKAQITCKTAGFSVNDHFVNANKTIDMPKGAKREIEDIILTRFW